ncbi:MAG: hypothetical protein MUP82_07465 [Candidatus Marinimicrobia bacterium]|nr:hypothetical protein [Candidatus Neomarinimicrobiota bacterium]
MSAYNDVLDELQDYILDDDRIKQAVKWKITHVKQEQPKVVQRPIQKPALFIPSQQDGLFWCFYIMKNGDVAYETINNKTSLLAKQEKIELVSTIRKNKDVVKMYKFDTITNLENNLANEPNLNVKTFLTLCAIENVNVIYVSNKTFYELLMNDSDVIYIVHELQAQSKYHKKYGYELAKKETIDGIKNSLYKLDVIDKPIKGISAYKVGDLVDICNKLDVEVTNKLTGKTKTKPELYESLIQYF